MSRLKEMSNGKRGVSGKEKTVKGIVTGFVAENIRRNELDEFRWQNCLI